MVSTCPSVYGIIDLWMSRRWAKACVNTAPQCNSAPGIPRRGPAFYSLAIPLPFQIPDVMTSLHNRQCVARNRNWKWKEEKQRGAAARKRGSEEVRTAADEPTSPNLAREITLGAVCRTQRIMKSINVRLRKSCFCSLFASPCPGFA